MSSRTFLCPPQIHPEQEDPMNLDEENDKIEGSLLNKSWSKYLFWVQDTYQMSSRTLLCPPQIHPEQEDPLNLDEENDQMEGSLLNKS